MVQKEQLNHYEFTINSSSVRRLIKTEVKLFFVNSFIQNELFVFDKSTLSIISNDGCGKPNIVKKELFYVSFRLFQAEECDRSGIHQNDLSQINPQEIS